MDGLADDSPFSSVISVADWIDGARGNIQTIVQTPQLLVLLMAVFLYVANRQSDLALVLICAAWRLRSSLIPLCYGLACSKYTLAILTLTFSAWTGSRFFGIISKSVDQSDGALPAAYLIPCRITHRRKFPKRHAFSYSYLTVGIPVGYRGSINGMISVDDADISTSWFSEIWRVKSWFRVDSDDYLERGSNKLGLRGKLDRYLDSQV